MAYPTTDAPTALPSHPFDELTTTTRDGLQLASRHYRPLAPPATPRRPVLCLPGLTRNSRDFHVVASALAGDADGRFGGGRHVYTLDFRGRGRSDRDKDPKNYAVTVEALDVLDVMAAHDLSDVAILGTSRGGLVAMVLAVIQPSAIGAVIMNDIGPVLEIDGLSRIVGYVGKTPMPHSWPDAVRVVKDINARHFTRMSDADWDRIARQLFDDVDGKPAANYDPAIAGSISVLKTPLPDMWPQFEALNGVPIMVLRGENSDLLSAATVAEMGRRHPNLTAHTVRWQGHAPWLDDADTIDVIARFLNSSDQPAGQLGPR
jgi:pimeloyl-ACP methyl ester carboxylesterase